MLTTTLLFSDEKRSVMSRQGWFTELTVLEGSLALRLLFVLDNAFGRVGFGGGARDDSYGRRAWGAVKYGGRTGRGQIA